jgi:PBP1b-binding outer membrane lipoprotein LpoB
MKKISIILAVLALALLLSTCKEVTSTTSVDECISNFMDDINSTDRSGIYKNLDPAAAMYAGAVTSTLWDTYFPTKGITYTLSNQSTSGGTVTATLSSTTYALYSGGVSISFGMGENSKGDAVISTIGLSGTNFFY